MNPSRLAVRASILAAVFGAVALFFVIGLRKVPAPAQPPPAASAPAR
jgi:hypothetical protein